MPYRIEILEMARIACATIPDTLVYQMDMSDDRFVEIRDHIHSQIEASLQKIEANPTQPNPTQ